MVLTVGCQWSSGDMGGLLQRLRMSYRRCRCGEPSSNLESLGIAGKGSGIIMSCSSASTHLNLNMSNLNLARLPVHHFIIPITIQMRARANAERAAPPAT